MFRYKLARWSWETKIWSNVIFSWETTNHKYISEKSVIIKNINHKVNSDVLIKSFITTQWETQDENWMRIKVNEIPISLYVKVRY